MELQTVNDVHASGMVEKGGGGGGGEGIALLRT
jgi:hypothetical protein